MSISVNSLQMNSLFLLTFLQQYSAQHLFLHEYLSVRTAHNTCFYMNIYQCFSVKSLYIHRNVCCFIFLYIATSLRLLLLVHVILLLVLILFLHSHYCCSCIAYTLTPF